MKKQKDSDFTWNEIEVNKFKKLILEMFDGFPNLIVVGKVEQVVKNDDMIVKLLDAGYLVRDTTIENGVKQVGYFLGPGALPLVSSWKSEELTDKVKKMTYTLLLLTFILVGFEVLRFAIS
jgi:hypothetical protein